MDAKFQRPISPRHAGGCIAAPCTPARIFSPEMITAGQGLSPPAKPFTPGRCQSRLLRSLPLVGQQRGKLGGRSFAFRFRVVQAAAEIVTLILKLGDKLRKNIKFSL